MQQLLQNFIAINNMKFPDAVTKTVAGVVILKTLLCTLLHNMFG
jgi:hypothetical protein